MILKCRAEVWEWQGKGAWHFVTLDQKTAKAVKQTQEGKKRVGWGSVPVVATVGQTSWKTSVFPYAKVSSYLLPLKASVRKKEGIKVGDTINISLLL